MCWRNGGAAGGADLLLYAPIDTHLEGDDSDYPWAGPNRTVDLQPARTYGRRLGLWAGFVQSQGDGGNDCRDRDQSPDPASICSAT
jgi:hypothetical protein